ncbi:MAG: M15 family metallopeptidase [Lachnospiraceae bacterium]|nr:M15 family metallopeptidase [Lachnospiraceae bacterium]
MDRRPDDQVQKRSAQTERQQSSRSNSSRMNQARAARRRRVMRNRIIFGAIVLLILLGIIFSIRGSAKHHQAKVKAKQEAQQKKSTDPAEEARKKAVKAAKKRENPLTEDTGDILMIVNKEYGLSEEYKPNDLTKVEHCDFSVGSDECHQLKKEPAEAIEEMFAAAREDGYEIIMRTGYRSYGYQAALYESYKEQDGEEAADKYSARPGSSEHQSGLCCDVGIEGKDLNAFEGTDEAKWIADNYWKYGFVVRYPQDKEDITGYMYEAWHIRYVGKEAAKYMHEKNLTLEEYLEL